MINSRHEHKERISQMFLLNGKNREKIERVVAGDIAVTIKLKDAHTSDSLMDIKKGSDGFEALHIPAALHTVAIEPVTTTDDEKMGSVLHEMHRTDPTIEIGFSRELKQMLVKTQGEFQINTIKWYLNHVYNINIVYLIG